MPDLNPNELPEKTAEAEQYILNLSFDHLHKLLMTGLLAINMDQLGPDGTPGRYDRLQIDDATGGLKVTTTNGSGGGGGSATSAKQDEQTEQLQQLAVVLKTLLQATVDTPALDKSLNRIRETAIIESGTITTVSTVNTVTNQSQIDSYQGKLLMVGQDISAWANVVRGRII